MPDVLIAEVPFVGGITRAVYVDGDGRQYVFDDEGQKVHGVWLHPDRWPEPDLLIKSTGPERTELA